MALLKITALAAIISSVFAQAPQPAIPKCGPGSKCPSATPCCSAYGQCGVGAYCLGGCDPLFSHQLNSCVAAPVCRSADYRLNSLNDVQSIDKYLGDPTKANWQSQGKPLVINDGILLSMAQDTVGTLLASTHYVWYGKISARMTSSRGKGVVTAFIMMSDTKDEIDFEFIGTDVDNVQSNYYAQGILDYNHSRNLSASNTFEQEHEYTIDWRPEAITWSVDGREMRKINRDETWNSSTNRFDFPQTPSRVMLSLWPAGLSSNGEGTINWAGGLVDWNSQYMQNGYYYAMVKEVKVECYQPPPGARAPGRTAYRYTTDQGVNSSIEITDDFKVLRSLYASGENPDLDPNASSSSSASSSTATASAAPRPETIPGVSGGGNRGDSEGQAQANNANNNNNGGGGASGTQPGAPGVTSTGNGEQTFSQNGGQSNNRSGATTQQPRNNVGGSVFAVLVAVVGLMFL